MSLKETSCQRCQKSSFDAACCIGVNVLMRTLFEPCVRHILESPALPNSNRVWRRVYRMYTSLNIHGSFVNHVAAAPYDSLMAIFWGSICAQMRLAHPLLYTYSSAEHNNEAGEKWPVGLIETECLPQRHIKKRETSQ